MDQILKMFKMFFELFLGFVYIRKSIDRNLPNSEARSKIGGNHTWRLSPIIIIYNFFPEQCGVVCTPFVHFNNVPDNSV